MCIGVCGRLGDELPPGVSGIGVCLGVCFGLCARLCAGLDDGSAGSGPKPGEGLWSSSGTKCFPLAMRKISDADLDLVRAPKFVPHRAPPVPGFKLSRQVQVGPPWPASAKLSSDHCVFRSMMIEVALWKDGLVRSAHSSEELLLGQRGPSGEEVHL